MRRLPVSVGVVAVLGSAACGGGGEDPDAARPTTVAAPETAAVGNDQAGTPFCQLAPTYTEKYGSLVTVVLTMLQRDNFDVSRPPDALTRLQEPNFQTAMSNLNRYGRAHCGIR